MESIVKRTGLGLVALLSLLLLATGCELSEGGADADDVGNGSDQGNDTPARCVSDGSCDATCAAGTDPDCDPPACECDRTNICNAASQNNSQACSCDDDCVGDIACGNDGLCDSFCPNNVDPDCAAPCACDRVDSRCDAAQRESSTECTCDPDCAGAAEACDSDGSYDDFCLARDPDYTSDCDFFEDVCEADDDNSTDRCDSDPDCGGADQACSDDGHCDTFCDPINGAPPPDFDCKDPDCNERADGTCRR